MMKCEYRGFRFYRSAARPQWRLQLRQKRRLTQALWSRRTFEHTLELLNKRAEGEQTPTVVPACKARPPARLRASVPDGADTHNRGVVPSGPQQHGAHANSGCGQDERHVGKPAAGEAGNALRRVAGGVPYGRGEAGTAGLWCVVIRCVHPGVRESQVVGAGMSWSACQASTVQQGCSGPQAPRQGGPLSSDAADSDAAERWMRASIRQGQRLRPPTLERGTHSTHSTSTALAQRSAAWRSTAASPRV